MELGTDSDIYAHLGDEDQTSKFEKNRFRDFHKTVALLRLSSTFIKPQERRKDGREARKTKRRKMESMVTIQTLRQIAISIDTLLETVYEIDKIGAKKKASTHKVIDEVLTEFAQTPPSQEMLNKSYQSFVKIRSELTALWKNID
jgi:hypothetical protein